MNGDSTDRAFSANATQRSDYHGKTILEIAPHESEDITDVELAFVARQPVRADAFASIGPAPRTRPYILFFVASLALVSPDTRRRRSGRGGVNCQEPLPASWFQGAKEADVERCQRSDTEQLNR